MKPAEPPKQDKPHHHHALTKASATHLFRAGHIDHQTHRKIVQHAERGMKAARGQPRTERD